MKIIDLVYRNLIYKYRKKKGKNDDVIILFSLKSIEIRINLIYDSNDILNILFNNDFFYNDYRYSIFESFK